MRKSDVIVLIIILILIITYLFIYLFTIKSDPILLDLSNKKATNIITNMINSSISQVLIDKRYEELIHIEKNNNSEITNLNFDNNKINEIQNIMTNNILNSINNLENTDNLIFYIPIGIIHSMPVITNIGPKIPFKINIISDINNESKVSIKDYGINNSMVEITLDISVLAQVIFPFKSNTVKIDKKILLDNKIIQGNIPTYYGGLNYLLK